ncbi:ankyrin repeat-containing domain protein [Lasiosphaeria miniovina]|uniref:Ankyrin repeat-containing domain protein n=1 Tax=Lasiosphaeria miniovina TaxID=1954250 RepID=A0AA39ZYH7_9PEZI|nr:ankyrin repeat-containing domain protein [Lasiosphaeria miniovina]KAK0705992.1 ankyrin repeat-containing domain protein [Lasiosphaeria miniovina]
MDDVNGKMPIHLAVLSGNFEMVQKLCREHKRSNESLDLLVDTADTLEQGAEPNVSDDESKTPLHFTYEKGEMDMMALLLAAGSDPFYRDSRGHSALHRAVKAQNLAIRALLNFGDLDAKSLAVPNHNNKSPLSIALRNQDMNTAKHGRVLLLVAQKGVSEVVEDLVKLPVGKDEDGPFEEQRRLALDEAAEHGWTEIGLSAYRRAVTEIAMSLLRRSAINDEIKTKEVLLSRSDRALEHGQQVDDLAKGQLGLGCRFHLAALDLRLDRGLDGGGVGPHTVVLAHAFLFNLSEALQMDTATFRGADCVIQWAPRTTISSILCILQLR